MAKRFTDTDKWGKPWFRGLPVKLKLAWTYLCDSCDSAGVWDGDFALMSFQMGESVTLDECLSAFGSDRVVSLPDGKVFLPGFIPFQYGTLKPEKNAAHRGILEKVKKLTLTRLHADSLPTLLRPSTEGYGEGRGKGEGEGNGYGRGEGEGNGEGRGLPWEKYL